MIKNYLFKKDNCKAFTNICKVSRQEFKEELDKNMLTSWAYAFIVALTLLFGNNTNAQTVITSPASGAYTWTAPCDVNSITVEVWGAGGGAAGATGNPAAGGGGSGGGYIKTVYTVTPGTTYNYYAGIGGIGGTTGTDGEASWFNTNAIIKAIGGKGAGAAISANSTYGNGATAYAVGNLTAGTVAFNTYGGSGGNASSTFSGAGGSSAGSTASGNGNSATGAAGAAPTNGYAGAAGITAASTAGSVGGIGAGGSGGRANSNTDRNGGAGGIGQVRITYTSSMLSYCAPTFTTTVEPITNVTFAGINNTTTNATGGASLQSFCLTGTVAQGSTTNAISIKGNTAGSFTDYIRVYIDWDQNGVYGNVANEIYDIGIITNSTGVDAITLTGNISVPATATLGNTQMRVMKNYNANPTGPCQTGAGYGQAEDYLITVTAPPAPTITSLNAGNGCPGSSLIITGTNLSSASAATIGLTAATITGNTATTVTVTVGAGTTGTVQVTTPGGTATSAATFTVNALPTIVLSSGAGTNSQTVCINTPITSFTHTIGGSATGASTAGLPAGVTGNLAGSVYTISGTPTVSGTFNYTITTSGGSCGNATATGTITVNPAPAITTNPSNSSIAVGANTSFTTVASNTPTSYTWQVSTDGGGTWTTVTNGGVYTNATTATLNITAAPIGMNGYQYHVSATNACGTSAYSTAATLTVTLAYCTPTHSVSCTGTITNVTFNTINNNSTCANTNGTSYTNYALGGAPTTTLFIGFTYNLSVTADVSSIVSAWIDYNQNGVFEASEWTQVYTTGTSGTISVTIPGTALTGNTTIRIRSRNVGNTNGSGDPCTSFGSGETEDYKITLTTPPACVAPTTQPSALVLSTPAGGTTINGTFTAAAPVPNNYLVVISTSPLPPTPVNGTTYTIGGTVETGGYLVVDTDNNTAFSATGLSPGTQYYIYIFSYNSLCSGGPLYNTTSPLNGTATTTTVVAGAYCTPSTTNTASSLYIKDVAFLGTLQDVSNYNNSYSGVTPGYQDFTGLPTKSRQAQGEGMNVYVGGANLSSANRGHWKAWIDWNKDGVFSDPGEKVYDSGGVATSTTTFGYVIPPTTAPGNYRIRIRLYNVYKTSNPSAGTEGPYSYDFNSCEVFDINGAYTEYGEAEDYLFTVDASCPAIIKTVTGGSTCGPGPVTISATGSVGTTSYHWYTALTGGSAIAGATAASYTTPSISSTTTYYVTADNGSCESKVRTAVVATVNPIPTLSFTPSNPQVCGENTIISLTASGDIENVHLINETFEAGTLGSFTNVNLVNNGATINAKTAWQNRTSTFVPAESVWFPAISSGFGKNKFAMSTSDVAYTVTEALTSSTVNTNTFLNLNLNFNIYYSSYLDGTDPTNDYVHVDVNDGSGWTTVASYTTDIGIGTKFDSKSIALNAYINKPTLQIRILYHGVFVDGTAVDNIDLYGDRPLATAFNWSGASLPDAYSNAACTVPYVAGTPAVTVWIKPTLAQLEQGNYTFTASAVLNNGCSASTPITVTNNTKVWKGTSSNNWNVANNWLPVGIPDANTCVVIPTGGTSQITNTPDALAKNVTVKAPTGNLELQAGKNLTVTDFINVESGATFNVRNNANLVQINSVANTGNITMQRIANLKLFDYAYWSTPVGNGTFPVSNISPATSTGYIFKWDPVGANSNGGQGNWINGNENMVLGKGYIVRGPNGFNNTTPSALTASFVGVPNNGTYNVTIQRGSDLNAGTPGPNGVMRTIKDDNWNLIGNPYPSSIKALDFLTANLNIDGNVRIWTHSTLPNSSTGNPFYGTYVLNYTPNDYIVHNGTGTTSGPAGFSGFIAAGQSFLVLMNDGAAGSSTVTFNNTMRNAAYNNSQFYKSSSVPQADSDIEKDRIWLDFLDQSSVVTRTLVGYVENATDDKDRMYDAITDYKNSTNFYSVLNDEIMTIQGKALPFNNSDTIKLGFKASANGSNFKIAIAAVDGLFTDESQNIYLEDKLLNVIYDLRTSPYTFSSNAGVYNDRFVLRYTNQNLSTGGFDYNNSVKIYASNRINVKSANQNIKEVSVFDILGKTIYNKKTVNAQELIINELSPTSNVLIVKVLLDDNTEVIKKVVF